MQESRKEKTQVCSPRTFLSLTSFPEFSICAKGSPTGKDSEERYALVSAGRLELGKPKGLKKAVFKEGARDVSGRFANLKPDFDHLASEIFVHSVSCCQRPRQLAISWLVSGSNCMKVANWSSKYSALLLCGLAIHAIAALIIESHGRWFAGHLKRFEYENILVIVVAGHWVKEDKSLGELFFFFSVTVLIINHSSIIAMIKIRYELVSR
jgi:hypothetical protein